ncbi:MAG TPA: ABC transporter ATP-binding protein [Chloroflexota bacterium]|nr:ABC transporter ATP-binding protein [Chloroflexota bacterium]
MKILLRILAYARPHWRTLAGALVVMTAEAAVRTAPAWFSAVVIDRAAADGTPWFLFLVVLGYFGVSAVARALAAVQNYCTEWLGQSVVHDLRNSLYRHLQSKSMSFYDVNQTGQLMSRVTGDVGQVQQFVASGVVRVLDSAVSITIFLAVMLGLDVQLTLVALSAAPVIFLTQLRVRRTRGTYREIQRLMAQLSNILQENVAAVKLVKAYNREPHEHRRFLDQYWQVRTRRLETTRVMGAWSQVQETATALSGVLVLVFGAIRLMEGSLTVGQLFAFQAYVGMLWGPVRFFGFINQSVQQALAAGERVFEVIDWPLDVAEKPDAVALPPLAGDLRFEAVSFGYSAGSPILREISLRVPAGTSLALVGPSGSGKTTLINLIPRFYDVTAGAVRVDGHDVRDVTLASLRAQVGMVMQETFLFNLSIRDNICYGRAEAPQDEIEAAAKAAAAHDFITEFPEGYETLIGERGVRLSGGQRQRLAIARAILVDPRVLILDEATSSVDTRTDFLIRRALDGLMRGRTTVVIAHRLSTVLRAGQIAYLESGRVVDCAPHDQLLERCPPYRHLFEIQFQRQEPADALPAPEAVISR